jgi:two-component system, response regulator PdtaR
MSLSAVYTQPIPGLPPSKGAPPRVPDSERKEPYLTNLTGKRVVIVEDDIITQMQLRKILTRNGLVVVRSAADGLEGIAATLEARPDLVLMDIRLPGDIDGLEAVQKILHQFPVCVVMLTAVPNPEFQDQAREIGACGYIIKPIDRDTLFPQLQEAVRTFEQG